MIVYQCFAMALLMWKKTERHFILTKLEKRRLYYHNYRLSKMIEKKAGKGKTVIITAISTDGKNKKANEQIKIK